jgi:hypothetical protein
VEEAAYLGVKESLAKGERLSIESEKTGLNLSTNHSDMAAMRPPNPAEPEGLSRDRSGGLEGHYTAFPRAMV